MGALLSFTSNKFSFNDVAKTANIASDIAVDVKETLTRKEIQIAYQKNLIDAANNMIDNNVRKLASVRLYCINKLEWEKTKSNFVYIIFPIIILIGLLIFYFSGKIDTVPIYIYIPIMIVWYLFYNTFYKKYKLIEWNKILFNINTKPITDIIKIEDITIKSIDKFYDSKYFHKLSI
jgi:hypothetical protein